MFLKRFVDVFFVVALFVTAATGEESHGQELKGSWVGINENGQSFTLIFGPKNMVEIRVGKDAGQGSYSVDWTKKPGHLDIDWGARGKVKTIVELKDDSLKIENVLPGKDRPKRFTGAATILKRSKEVCSYTTTINNPVYFYREISNMA